MILCKKNFQTLLIQNYSISINRGDSVIIDHMNYERTPICMVPLKLKVCISEGTFI